MYIEKKEGLAYIARPSKGRKKLLWSVIRIAGNHDEERVDADEVPRLVRKRVYNQRWKEKGE